MRGVTVRESPCAGAGDGSGTRRRLGGRPRGSGTRPGRRGSAGRRPCSRRPRPRPRRCGGRRRRAAPAGGRSKTVVAPVDAGRAGRAGVMRDVVELMRRRGAAAAREVSREGLLRRAEDVDRECARLLEHRQDAGPVGDADQDQRRVERQRGERLAGHAVLHARRARGHHGHAGGEPPQRGRAALGCRCSCAVLPARSIQPAGDPARKAARVALPEDGGGVLGDGLVGRDDGHVVEDRLGDEAAVEGVRVDAGQERVMHGAGFVEGRDSISSQRRRLSM